MPITSYDYLPTTQSRAPVEPEASGAAPETGAAPGLEGESGPIGKVGIVFVHGIGTQKPAETFLDWSTPIVDLLRDWRVSIGVTGDPVIRSEFSFNPAGPPILELDIPAYAERPAARWLVTEAWWAADLRAPAFGTIARYLSRNLNRIVSGIAAGYASRAASIGGRREHVGYTPPRRWRWVGRLDRIQAAAFSNPVVFAPIVGLGIALLGFFTLLRQVPIKAVRDFAELRLLESFLVEWFGDLPVVVADPVQAANIRRRLVDAIDRLKLEGAGPIVLVAHSGGAIVSFSTLCDPVFEDRRVTKLITLGQGLGLAWRLAAGSGTLPKGDRLGGPLGAARADLRWIDVWSSYDPAPAGSIDEEEGLAPPWIEAVEAHDRRLAGALAAPPLLVEDRPVTNRMNVLTDHGAYWDNDEGFLIPLVRHLDIPDGPASGSRFYGDELDRHRRIEWRRQRVGVLAAWGWICSTLTALAVVVALATGGGARLAGFGEVAVGAWNVIPGHELISGPVDAFGRLLGTLGDLLGANPALSMAGSAGPLILAIALIVLAFYFLASFGNGRWSAWDRRERLPTRAERPTPPRRTRVVVEAGLLLGVALGLAALVAFGVVPVAVGIGGATVLLAWGLAFIVRAAPEAARPAPSADL